MYKHKKKNHVEMKKRSTQRAITRWPPQPVGKYGHKAQDYCHKYGSNKQNYYF